MAKKKRWETYEEVAAYLLNQIREALNLSTVEGKQKLRGSSGVDWEIDAKGIKEDGSGIVIIECRRYKNSRQNQERVAALAFRISDLGAEGGIIVSPLGLQRGAKILADATNIISVEIDPDSTPADFTVKFLNKVFLGSSVSFSSTLSMKVIPTLRRRCTNCGDEFIVEKEETECEKCRIDG